MYLDLENSLKLWYHHKLVIQSSTGHPSQNGKPYKPYRSVAVFTSLIGLKKKLLTKVH